MIKRGDNYTIPAPSRFEKIYPGDVLFIIGTDEQIDKFKNFIELPGEDNTDLPGTREVILKKITAKEVSALLDKTIRESGIREKTNGLVVGIERKGRRILNPASETIFESEDKIWIVGDALLIDELLSRQ
jgi:monovalent cation:H+ antiporter-2, CPA2 family